jgi:hypothetical protein
VNAYLATLPPDEAEAWRLVQARRFKGRVPLAGAPRVEVDVATLRGRELQRRVKAGGQGFKGGNGTG